MAAYQCLNCGQIESGNKDCCNSPDLFKINDMPGEIKRLRTALEDALKPGDKTRQIAECVAAIKPLVRGKFPAEQALDELVGYTAAPPAQTPVPPRLTLEEIDRAWFAAEALDKEYACIRAIETAVRRQFLGDRDE